MFLLIVLYVQPVFAEHSEKHTTATRKTVFVGGEKRFSPAAETWGDIFQVQSEFCRVSGFFVLGIFFEF